MSVKEIVHKWVDELPDDAPDLLDFYERARLSQAIEEGMEDVRAGRMVTFDEIDQRMQAKWAKRDSASK